MSASGADRISTFERHCWLLLRAYPAAYRSERGAEIIGTLLETTPEGRDWPVPRDIRSLAAGGLRARAQLNRRNTTAANLRVAVLVGITAYFAFNAAVLLHFRLSAGDQVRFAPTELAQILAATLITACALIAWVSSRAIVLMAALPAAAACAIAGPWGYQLFGSEVTNLACVAAVIVLAGRERPSRRWLLPIGVIVLAVLLPVTNYSGGFVLACLLPLVLASIVWFAVDARPVIALAVFVLAAYLPATIDDFSRSGNPQAGVPLAICGAVAALAIWRLRRRSVSRTR